MYAQWGTSVSLPTKDEWTALNNTYNANKDAFDANTKQYYWKWESVGGHNGYTITWNHGTTDTADDTSIFLPAAGWRSGTSFSGQVSRGDYWSSSLDTSAPYRAWAFYFLSGYNGTLKDYGRVSAFSLRAIKRI